MVFRSWRNKSSIPLDYFMTLVQLELNADTSQRAQSSGGYCITGRSSIADLLQASATLKRLIKLLITSTARVSRATGSPSRSLRLSLSTGGPRHRPRARRRGRADRRGGARKKKKGKRKRAGEPADANKRRKGEDRESQRRMDTGGTGMLFHSEEEEEEEERR